MQECQGTISELVLVLDELNAIIHVICCEGVWNVISLTNRTTCKNFLCFINLNEIKTFFFNSYVYHLDLDYLNHAYFFFWWACFGTITELDNIKVRNWKGKHPYFSICDGFGENVIKVILLHTEMIFEDKSKQIFTRSWWALACHQFWEVTKGRLHGWKCDLKKVNFSYYLLNFSF